MSTSTHVASELNKWYSVPPYLISEPCYGDERVLVFWVSIVTICPDSKLESTLPQSTLVRVGDLGSLVKISSIELDLRFWSLLEWSIEKSRFRNKSCFYFFIVCLLSLLLVPLRMQSKILSCKWEFKVHHSWGKWPSSITLHFFCDISV